MVSTPLHIIIDTREQTPWAFPLELATCVVRKLDAGDYALVGDPEFSIERKSLDDFAGTISTGWKRFKRELDRMWAYPVKVVIVEGCLRQCCFYEQDSDLCAPVHNHFMLQPQFVLKRVAELAMQDVQVHWADSSDIAAGLAYAILKERANAIND